MPPPDLESRVQRLLGKQPLSWRAAQGGYTTAERWIVTFADGSSAFVKETAEDDLARRLRIELSVYSQVDAGFMPKVIASENSPSPMLVLEDLSEGHWPPPWRPGDVQRVVEALTELHTISAPEGIHQIRPEEFQGWKFIQDDPNPFLRLDLASEQWLAKALPTLVEAESNASISGDAFIHVDVRSDNICLLDDRVVLVDWGNARQGNGDFDLAAWLPSLHAEGGPEPSEILPGAGCLAAAIAGYFASWAGLPPPDVAPLAREVQLQQLKTALPWVIKELELEPLDR